MKYLLIILLFSACSVEPIDCTKKVNSDAFFEVLEVDSNNIDLKVGDTIKVLEIDSTTFEIKMGSLKKVYQFQGQSKVQGKEDFELFLSAIFPISAIHTRCENDTTKFELTLQNQTQTESIIIKAQ